MKITRKQLRQLIQEEVFNMSEGVGTTSSRQSSFSIEKVESNTCDNGPSSSRERLYCEIQEIRSGAVAQIDYHLKETMKLLERGARHSDLEAQLMQIPDLIDHSAKGEIWNLVDSWGHASTWLPKIKNEESEEEKHYYDNEDIPPAGNLPAGKKDRGSDWNITHRIRKDN